MEIVVTGRHTEVTERFRRHLEEKLAKVTQLAPKMQRLDVVVSHEPNRRQSKACERVEITCLDRGPVVRAEACADDPYAALDIAYGKLAERLRRMRDRKRVHRGRRAPGGAVRGVGPGRRRGGRDVQRGSCLDDAASGGGRRRTSTRARARSSSGRRPTPRGR